MDILKIDTGQKRDVTRFLDFPFQLYRRTPQWVPPLASDAGRMLDRKKHPFYANAEAEFFLARRDGRVVGRIAAILDRAYNRFQEESTGFFGFFECIDDQTVANALCDAARAWLKSRLMRRINSWPPFIEWTMKSRFSLKAPPKSCSRCVAL